MDQFNFLSKLRDVQPDGSPFVSLYLNTEPNETGKKNHGVFLKKQISDRLAVLAEGSDERSQFEKLGERITEFADQLDPSVRGAAVFAGSGDDAIFQTFEFTVPFDEDRLYLFDRPYLFPLVRLIAQNPTYAVVAADTNSAHIYVFKRSELVRREDIQNTKTNKSEVGGWSQMRYQRHIENFHQQHAKEVVQELEKIVQGSRIEHIVLVGDQAVIIPLLRAEMSEELTKKVADSIAMNVNSPEHEIAEAASEAIVKHRADAEKEMIDQLFEVDYEDGVGVTGFDKTLAALFNGQVQELYVSSDPENILYRTDEVRVLLKNYAPGLDESMPDVNEKEIFIDELLKQASLSADNIRIIEDPHLLKTVGGVGALLRYQAKGVSNL